MSDLSRDGPCRGLAASAAPGRAPQPDGRRRRRLTPDAVVTVEFGKFLAQARASPPRLRHPDRPLRRAAAVGLAPGPREKAWRARQPHHGVAAVRGFRSSPTTAFPRPMSATRPSRSGVDRGDGPGFRARHGIPADSTVLCVLPGSQGGEVKPPASGVRRGAAACSSRAHPDLAHRHSGRARRQPRPCGAMTARMAVSGGARQDGGALRRLRRIGRRHGQVGHGDARTRACRRPDGGRLQGQRRPPPSSSAAWA